MDRKGTAIGRSRRGATASSRHSAVPHKSLPPTPVELQAATAAKPAATVGDGMAACASDDPTGNPAATGSGGDDDEEMQDMMAQPAGVVVGGGGVSGDSEIALTDDQMEEAVGIIYSFLDDEDKFRVVGVAMNVLPSPPWDPALEDTTDPTALYSGDKDDKANKNNDPDSGMRRSRRISFWGKKSSAQSFLKESK
jgi:hypothetical protein